MTLLSVAWATVVAVVGLAPFVPAISPVGQGDPGLESQPQQGGAGVRLGTCILMVTVLLSSALSIRGTAG